MIPLKTCWAWTIWKAQQQTLNKNFVIELGKSEREHALSYTAFSRATKLIDVGIRSELCQDRLVKKIRKHKKMEKVCWKKNGWKNYMKLQKNYLDVKLCLTHAIVQFVKLSFCL